MRLRFRPEQACKEHGLQGYGLMRRVVNVVLGLMALCLTAQPVHAGGSTVLALGDSLTAGYGLDQADAFPVQLQAALRADGHDVTVINAGVSGDTSAGGRSRLDWLLSADVDAVIVELGANDGLRGIEPTETRANLDWILATLQARGLPTLLSGMLAPPNLGQDYGREFNALYPALAEKYGVPLDPFFLEGVAADAALNLADGLHPNRAGVAIIVRRLAPQVIELLARSDQPKP